MFQGNIVGTIDVAELSLIAFVLFFIALVFYLRREDRREGYPLEDEFTGRLESYGGPLLMATPKTFRLSHGRDSVVTPTKGREPVDIAARRTDRFAGAPYEPTGNPLADGIGPAAYAERSREPDIDAHGEPRLAPLSAAPAYALATRDPDPRGMTVIAADGAVAGTVSDVWIDRAEHVVRYLEVTTPSGAHALAPMPMAKIRHSARQVVIDAINADQFAGVPQPAVPGRLSRYEEERVSAYFGGGYLYANRSRQEPLL